MSTKIEWCDETWNPVTGCTKISEGCKNCYAERMSKRLAGRFGYPVAPHNFDVTWHESMLDRPLHWRKPRRVFVCSMGDLFHEAVSNEWRRRVWDVMRACRRHTFMVLTKRPGRAWVFMHHLAAYGKSIYLPNLRMGNTVENQKQADRRMPLLLQVAAAVRYVSLEPLLEMINLENYLGIWTDGVINPRQKIVMWEPLTPNLFTAMAKPDGSTLYKKQLDWVIVGAETGPGARPMELDWARSVRDQCQVAGVPFFFKRDSDGNRELDGRLWEEFPR